MNRPFIATSGGSSTQLRWQTPAWNGHRINLLGMLLLLFLLMAAMQPAWAHKPSDSYLGMTVEGNVVNGQWDIALRDLDFAIGLDHDGDGNITWGEVRARQKEIDAYALARLQISAQGKACNTQAGSHLIDNHTDGAYLVLRLRSECPSVKDTLALDYRLFFDIDPQHKGLLKLRFQDAVSTGIFSPEKPHQEFALSRPDRWSQFVDYCREGVWHIWIGIDHILFLVALLLPAVLVRKAGGWHAVREFRPALVAVLQVVTAFTVAHSITLSLATLGLLSLPSRWVEATIAASVVLAALNNVFFVFAGNRWLMAFVFGLIHGFGFAAVLGDLGLPQGARALALLGFNLGVEAGQLAIVAVFLPLAYLLRASRFYRRFIFTGGSLVIALVALIWLAERMFDLQLMKAWF